MVRFLDTRGLADVEGYDPAPDIAHAMGQSHLIMVVARVDDLALDEVLSPLRAARSRHPTWPVLVAQTTLHNCYARGTTHALPYPFTGTDADFALSGISDTLRGALQGQRALLGDLPGEPPRFVPLDFTRAEDGLAPTDYGHELLWTALEHSLPEVVARLAASVGRDRDNDIRRKIIAPCAFAAGTVNAIPVPVLGGLGSASLQALMVRNIAQRFGLATGRDAWGEFLGAAGTGFAISFAGSWVAQQVLKLAPGVGAAIVASWTFAMTWGIGEMGIYYFGQKAAGRSPDSGALAQVYRQAFARAKSRRRQGSDRA